MTTRARYDLFTTSADTAGIVVKQPQRRSALMLPPGEEPGAPRRLSWAEIDRIDGTNQQCSGSHLLEGTLVGGILGLAAMGIVLSTTDYTREEQVAVVGLLPFGLLIGALAGGSIHRSTGWHPLYP